MNVFVPHKKDANIYLDEIMAFSKGNFIFGDYTENDTNFEIINIHKYSDRRCTIHKWLRIIIPQFSGKLLYLHRRSPSICWTRTMLQTLLGYIRT